MSTQPIQPAWKQEVNQRIAAHKNRKGTADSGARQPELPPSGASRAAAAAARVAQRYAKAPTYSQLQAEEARAAVRAAEIATQVAMEAQAAAESALAELHAASEEQTMRGPAVIESIAGPARAVDPETQPIAPPASEPASQSIQNSPQHWPATPASDPIESAHSLSEPAPRVPAPNPPGVLTQEIIDDKSFNLRWEPDLPARALQMPPAPRSQQEFELSVEDWWTPARVSATLHGEPIQVDAPATQANLIQFPRELVAARKMRPRLAETVAGLPTDSEAQLSIFEVDPGTISTEPMAEPQQSQASPAEWNGPVWSGMELDAEPIRARSALAEPAARRVPYLAPFGLRLMALVIDGALILGTFSAFALWMVARMAHVPAPKSAELMVAAGLLVTAFAYHALFFTWTNATPGMRYAGIALCTFDDDVPTRRQLRRRLGAMAVSLLPVGLGMVWSVFDEDHLSWHDRISQTYLRKR